MSLLSDIVCTAGDLLQCLVKFEAKALVVKMEEQAKSMEFCFKRMCLWCGLLAAGLLVLLTGIGFAITGVYILLAASTGAGIAALIVGVIVMLLSAVLAIAVKNSIR